VRDHVPAEIGWLIRYHSFQSVAGDSALLFDDRDRRFRDSHMRVFARYDLYSEHPDDVSTAHLDEYRELLDCSSRAASASAALHASGCVAPPGRAAGGTGLAVLYC
jgi:hypothetical protein